MAALIRVGNYQQLSDGSRFVFTFVCFASLACQSAEISLESDSQQSVSEPDWYNNVQILSAFLFNPLITKNGVQKSKFEFTGLMKYWLGNLSSVSFHRINFNSKDYQITMMQNEEEEEIRTLNHEISQTIVLLTVKQVDDWLNHWFIYIFFVMGYKMSNISVAVVNFAGSFAAGYYIYSVVIRVFCFGETVIGVWLVISHQLLFIQSCVCVCVCGHFSPW